MIAAIVPTPSGTASCMYFPLFLTSDTAVLKSIVPDATWAEYSPRLSPAVISGFIPASRRGIRQATLAVTMAGCVFSVILSVSSSPSKIIPLISMPRASFA